MGVKHNSKVTNNGHRANQRTADAQLPGVKMRTPSTSRAPKKLRLLGIKTKSVRPHPLCDPLNSKLHPSLLQSIRERWAPRVELRVVGVEMRWKAKTSRQLANVCRVKKE